MFLEYAASWSLIGVTFLSVLVSGVLGWLAYWNGRRAGKIAEEAVERDDTYRKAERSRLRDEERTKVAFAISIAINSEDYRTSPNVESEDRKLEASGYSNRLHLDALAHINLMAREDPDSLLRPWFVKSIRALRDTDRTTELGRIEYRNKLRAALAAIAAWGYGQLDPVELPDIRNISAETVGPDDTDIP